MGHLWPSFHFIANYIKPPEVTDPSDPHENWAPIFYAADGGSGDHQWRNLPTYRSWPCCSAARASPGVGQRSTDFDAAEWGEDLQVLHEGIVGLGLGNSAGDVRVQRFQTRCV